MTIRVIPERKSRRACAGNDFKDWDLGWLAEHFACDGGAIVAS